MPGVILTEEGMREGLQIEDAAIPVADKVRLLDALSATGLRKIVVGSFVSPRWTPQMAGIDELVTSFAPQPEVTYTALALNARGVERRAGHVPPLSTRDVLWATNVHVCDVFAQRNTNRTREAEVAAWGDTVAAAVEASAQEAQVGLGAAYGSNWVGPFSRDDRMVLLATQVELWDASGIVATRVSLADPMGWNTPSEVAGDLEEIRRRWPAITRFHLHLHNTRGCAPVSLYEALRVLGPECVVEADCSIGGMAGCPYCGNGRAATLTPTEDFVYLLESLGYDTGIGLDALIEAVVLAEEVVGHRLHGHVSKAGPAPQTADRLYPMDLPFVETLDQAQHWRLGAEVTEGALSPWSTAIRSQMREDVESALPGS